MRLSLGRRPLSPLGARRIGSSPPRRPENWPGDDRAAARFAAAEPDSLALIVHHYAAELFPLAASLVGAEAGEALLEEAFLRALSARDRYRGTPPLGEWLRALVEESGKERPQPAMSGNLGVAPPFALASRLVARLEEKSAGRAAVFRRFALLQRRTRLALLGGACALVVVWVLIPGPEAAPTPEENRAVPVFFDSSPVIREAVTPPGRVPVVTVHEAAGRPSSWRLLGSPYGRRIPTGLTSIYRLELTPEGKVVSVEKILSVPSVPPKEVEELLRGLTFEAVPGRPRSGTVEVRVVAE